MKDNTQEESDALDQPVEDDLPAIAEQDDEKPNAPKFRTPGFTRMRTSWREGDLEVIQVVQNEVEDQLFKLFREAFLIMEELFEVVREPLVDPNTGEIMKDRHGLTLWRKNELGRYVEDWTKLTRRARENYLFAITTRLFAWQQIKERLWMDSMLAKAKWEELYSQRYNNAPRGRNTIEARTASAKEDAVDERYFTIYLTSLSRRADALIRSMELIGQRIKDTEAFG